MRLRPTGVRSARSNSNIPSPEIVNVRETGCGLGGGGGGGGGAGGGSVRGGGGGAGRGASATRGGAPSGICTPTLKIQSLKLWGLLFSYRYRTSPTNRPQSENLTTIPPPALAMKFQLSRAAPTPATR